jgi:apolipoprotein N-acyltransferase
VLFGLSYLPGPFLPLNLAAFVPLLHWLDRRGETTAYGRLVAGGLFGTTAGLVAFHFMYSMLEQSWLAALLYLGMSLLFGLRISLSVALAGWLRRQSGLSWGLLLPLAWLPLEWGQTWGDLRMTGEHVAHSVAGYPFLVQFADLVGPYGVGAALLAANGLLYESTGRTRSRARWQARLALAGLAAAVLGYDLFAWTRPAPPGPTLRVALVQPNVPLAVKHAPDTVHEQWTQLVELTREAARDAPDLIVWPESARPLPLVHDLARPETWSMMEVQGLARQVGVPLIVGTEYTRIRAGARESYNAALAVDAAGRLLETWAAKVYLVPFVEATPFRKWLGPLVQGRGGEWQWLAGAFDPGRRDALIPIAGARVGVLVCYEQLFFDLARGLRNAGAELQVVITNDAWFGRSLFQPYLANALRLRAIESRSAFVRVANTGISGFVDAHGRYHRRTPLFEAAVETWDVPLAGPPTIYNRTGDVAAWLAIVGLAFTIALARRGPGLRAAA